jgi:hypothetical protein
MATAGATRQQSPCRLGLSFDLWESFTSAHLPVRQMLLSHALAFRP